jgi:hypothetical protein
MESSRNPANRTFPGTPAIKTALMKDPKPYRNQNQDLGMLSFWCIRNNSVDANRHIKYRRSDDDGGRGISFRTH